MHTLKWKNICMIFIYVLQSILGRFLLLNYCIAADQQSRCPCQKSCLLSLNDRDQWQCSVHPKNIYHNAEAPLKSSNNPPKSLYIDKRWLLIQYFSNDLLGYTARKVKNKKERKPLSASTSKYYHMFKEYNDNFGPHCKYQT